MTLIARDYGQSQQKNTGIIRVPSRHLFLDPEDRLMKITPIVALAETLEPLSFDILHVQTPLMHPLIISSKEIA